MDNRLDYDKLLQQLNRIHDKWQDARISVDQIDRKNGLQLGGLALRDVFKFLEDLTNDLLIAVENSEIVDEDGA